MPETKRLSRFVAALLVAASLCVSTLVSASTFEQGLDAYDKGKYSEAVELWTRLANEGHEGAQFNLAVMYEQGVGVGKDLKQSATLYKKIAVKGDIAAQFAIAAMYEKGMGVELNLNEARKWYGRVKLNKDLSSDAKMFQQSAEVKLNLLPKPELNVEVPYEGGRFIFNEATDGYCVIALQGKITNDTTFQFVQVIKKSKQMGCETNWILLESTGGKLADGIKLGREMHFEGYKTIARDYCASSCGLIFMGGVERVLYGSKARIGLHQPSVTWQDKRSCQTEFDSAGVKEIRSFLRFMLPDSASKVFEIIMKTSCESITWVSGKQAIDLGIATKLEEPNLVLKFPKTSL
jgi:ATP-dependent protease ClpP protease subunit